MSDFTLRLRATEQVLAEHGFASLQEAQAALDEERFGALMLAIAARERKLTKKHAPREIASSPKAPVPAKRSRTWAPGSGLPWLPLISRLKMDSRTRSVVGRRWAAASPVPTSASFRPRNAPPMILMGRAPDGGTLRPPAPPCRIFSHRR